MTPQKWQQMDDFRKDCFIYSKLGKDWWLLVKGDLYYRANMSGYTSDLSCAGRYSEKAAKDHARGTSKEVVAIPEPIPNYIKSLDLMREAEKALTSRQVDQYCACLNQIVHSNVCLAEAFERAEAFALTIEPE